MTGTLHKEHCQEQVENSAMHMLNQRYRVHSWRWCDMKLTMHRIMERKLVRIQHEHMQDNGYAPEA